MKVCVPNQIHIGARDHGNLWILALEIQMVFVSLNSALQKRDIAKVWERYLIIELGLVIRCFSDVITNFQSVRHGKWHRIV